MIIDVCISWSYYTKSNPVNSQETRFCWQKTSSVRNFGIFEEPIFEYRVSMGWTPAFYRKIRVSQEIYFVYEKTLFLIQNHEQDDVSIKHLQTDVFKFP